MSTKMGKLLGWLKDLAWVAGAYLLLTNFVVEAYQVPTPSMAPTIEGNPNVFLADRLIVEKVSPHFRDLEIGDIVVFMPPSSVNESTPFLKRVVGLPGNRLELRSETLWVDERPEPRLQALERRYMPGGLLQPGQVLTVPAGHLFLMGDNTDNSLDSRFFGPIPVESVRGRVVFRFWPPGRFGPLD